MFVTEVIWVAQIMLGTILLKSKVVRPSQGFWGTGEQGQFFQGNRGTKA